MVINRYIKHANRYLGIAERANAEGDYRTAATFLREARGQIEAAERRMATYTQKTRERLNPNMVALYRRQIEALQVTTDLAQFAAAGAKHGHTWGQA